MIDISINRLLARPDWQLVQYQTDDCQVEPEDGSDPLYRYLLTVWTTDDQALHADLWLSDAQYDLFCAALDPLRGAPVPTPAAWLAGVAEREGT